MNFDQLPKQVIDVTALFVIMFWGQPMDRLVDRARNAMNLPDAKPSGLAQAALARFSTDLEAGAKVPWQRYSDVHAEMRILKGKKEITYGEGTLGYIKTIGNHIQNSGVDFTYLFRGEEINKPLVILCALLWAAGEGK